MVKNPLANVGDPGDEGSIPGSGRSPGGGHGNPLLPGESHEQRSLAGKELDMTEMVSTPPASRGGDG